MMRKLLCNIMVLSLCLALVLPASASAANNTNIENQSNAVLQYEEYENGDILFSVVENETVIATSYLNRADNTITDTVFENGASTQIETDTYPEPDRTCIEQSVMPTTSEYSLNSVLDGYVGRIAYQYYDNSLTYTRSTSIYCKYDVYPGNQYDLNGTYKSLASLASYIAGILAVPAATASIVAGNVLTFFGISAGTLNYLIPTHYVSATRTSMVWKGADYNTPSYSTTFSGEKYDVTETGYSGRTYYDGDYWDLSAFTNHNSAFAVHVFQALYGNYSITILGWY